MKRNAMLDKIEAKYDALFRLRMDMLMQMGQDAAMIAAHDVLQLGPGRAEAFCRAYIEAMNGMARIIVDDQRDDKEFVYAKAKIDEQIKAIVGEGKFLPWEGRYGKGSVHPQEKGKKRAAQVKEAPKAATRPKPDTTPLL